MRLNESRYTNGSDKLVCRQHKQRKTLRRIDIIIFLTGLPCSGKTTIAKALAEELDPPLISKVFAGDLVRLLDGDTLRNSDFAKGVGFSKEERNQHILRVGYLARELNKYVPYVICSFVAPYEEIRKRIKADIMIYVKCPVDICIQRDVKGMYKKALAGEIKNFTGLDGVYEEPEKPDLILETNKKCVRECVDDIIKCIKKQF